MVISVKNKPWTWNLQWGKSTSGLWNNLRVQEISVRPSLSNRNVQTQSVQYRCSCTRPGQQNWVSNRLTLEWIRHPVSNISRQRRQSSWIWHHRNGDGLGTNEPIERIPPSFPVFQSQSMIRFPGRRWRLTETLRKISIRWTNINNVLSSPLTLSSTSYVLMQVKWKHNNVVVGNVMHWID